MSSKRYIRENISDMVNGIEYDAQEPLGGNGFVLKPDRDFRKQELNALYLTLYNRLDNVEHPYHRYEELNVAEMRDIVRGLTIVADEDAWPEGTDALEEEKIGDNGDPLTKVWLGRIEKVLRKTG